jgi:Fic family protein
MSNYFDLQILKTDYLADYTAQVKVFDLSKLPKVPPVEITTDTFSFYTSISSVFSSKIEGENIELDNYMKHKYLGGKYLPDYTKKIDDLFLAYDFAQNNRLNYENAMKVHTLLTMNILPETERGHVRNRIEQIIDTRTGRIEFVAASPFIVKVETDKLFSDIKTLMSLSISNIEAFYFATMIHLVFLKIHPFRDGNGRFSRLLEKWFLAEQLGEEAWFIKSEKYYYDNLPAYYRNVHIGFDYQSVDYDRCLPFLLMFPQSLNYEAA